MASPAQAPPPVVEHCHPRSAAAAPAPATSGGAAAAAPSDSTDAGAGAGAGAVGGSVSPPVVILIVGTAGSGKTTLVSRLSAELRLRGDSTYLVNLDPAVVHLPYAANIDIRDTVNYKELMKQYSLGPNGAIVTALNLFATRFDTVMDLLKARAGSTRYVLVDTPGQIEVFTWSASGNLVTDMLASSFPTLLLYVVDTPRARSPVTFMSNMLYACSILYKTRLPFVLCFNKSDVTPHDFAIEWMSDYDAFQTALNEVSDRSDAYIHSLTRSLSLALDEFYSTLRAVGVSSVTGLGYDDLKVAIDAGAVEYKESVLPELQSAQRVRAAKEEEGRERDLARIRNDVFGATGAGLAAEAVARAAGGGGGGAMAAAAAAMGGGARILQGAAGGGRGGGAAAAACRDGGDEEEEEEEEDS